VVPIYIKEASIIWFPISAAGALLTVYKDNSRVGLVIDTVQVNGGIPISGLEATESSPASQSNQALGRKTAISSMPDFGSVVSSYFI
jgi:hypothetical protein